MLAVVGLVTVLQHLMFQEVRVVVEQVVLVLG
jgi:hypothetical protein